MKNYKSSVNIHDDFSLVNILCNRLHNMRNSADLYSPNRGSIILYHRFNKDNFICNFNLTLVIALFVDSKMSMVYTFGFMKMKKGM